MRCRVGDLAVIVAPGSFGDGFLVEVLRVATPGDVHDWEPSVWWCRSLGSGIRTKLLDGDVRLLRERPIRDRNLRPIRPDAEPESTTTPRELEAA